MDCVCEISVEISRDGVIEANFDQISFDPEGLIFADGGTPFSQDTMVYDGGTPFTRDEIMIDCGNP